MSPGRLVEVAEIRTFSTGRQRRLVVPSATRSPTQAHLTMGSDQAAAVRRWRRGQMLAAERNRELVAREGPRPAQAVAEALSAVAALETMGIWPGPRDPVSEAAVLQVRRRWARIQRRAKTAQQR
jgi:SLT domain-containing protein